MNDFGAAVSPESKPKKDRIGATGVSECLALIEAQSDADFEFSERARERSPTTTVTRRGKVVEAFVTFSYNDKANKVKYRMETKKIDG